MDQEVKLSKEQKDIVNLNEGSYLILASAGSGKTRILTERVKRLSKLNQGDILAITFTNKAAIEIKDRLACLANSDNNVFAGTFHSFCQSILEFRFKLLGYEAMPHLFENEDDREELIKQAINIVPLLQEKYNCIQDIKNKNKYIKDALQFISTVKRDVVSANELANKSDYKPEYQDIYDTYQDILRSNNAIDYDDIIRLVYELFSNNEAVANLYRTTYSFICIDECQDLNKLQYLFLTVFCGDIIKNVMMVGDPNQSIFAFAGSSTSFMDEYFKNDFTATEKILTQNYRCSKAVINASNLLMGINVPVDNYAIGGEFAIECCRSEEEEAKFVVNKIVTLITMRCHGDIEGDISYDKISILARNVFLLNRVEKELKIANIPYFYKPSSGGIKFSSNMMKIFYLYFIIKINPSDKLHQNELKSFLKVNDLFDITELQKSNYRFAAHIKSTIDSMNISNINKNIDDLYNNLKENNFDNDNDKELALNELDNFKQQFQLYSEQTNSPTLSGFKAALALGLTNTFNNNDNGVCLSTIHTMKGQESEIVFLIGMNEGRLPDYRVKDKDNEGLQQEKNAAYVAFTRAKRFLYVSYSITRLMPWGDVKSSEKSRFLVPLQTQKT